MIHLAFSNDFNNLERGIIEETRGDRDLGAALEGSDKAARDRLRHAGRARPSLDRAGPDDDRWPVGGRGRAALAALA